MLMVKRYRGSGGYRLQALLPLGTKKGIAAPSRAPDPTLGGALTAGRPPAATVPLLAEVDEDGEEGGAVEGEPVDDESDLEAAERNVSVWRPSASRTAAGGGDEPEPTQGWTAAAPPQSSGADAQSLPRGEAVLDAEEAPAPATASRSRSAAAAEALRRLGRGLAAVCGGDFRRPCCFPLVFHLDLPAPHLRRGSAGASASASAAIRAGRPEASAARVEPRAPLLRPPPIAMPLLPRAPTSSLAVARVPSDVSPVSALSRRSKALEHRAFSKTWVSEREANNGGEDLSNTQAKTLQASGTRILLKGMTLNLSERSERSCTTLVQQAPGACVCVGPRLSDLIRPGDVLKISRPRNVADHVMLVVQRPKAVAVIEVDGENDEEAATIAEGAYSEMDIYEVLCLESSNNLEYFERRTYWIVAHPGDCCLAIIDPDHPANISEWEQISVLNSPFHAVEQGATAEEDSEVVYGQEGGVPGATLENDVVVDQSYGGMRVVRQVRPGGPADQAGVKEGDLLLRVGFDCGEVLATFRPDPRRVRLDWKAFNFAVWEVEQQKLQWSLRTATRAVICRARILQSEYAGEEGLRRLAQELRDHWAEDPICTTVPIRVWQRYFFKVWEGDDVTAAGEVLRVMPCKGDRTLPSELWAALLETGLWSEVTLTPASWKAVTVPVVPATPESKGIFTPTSEGADSQRKGRYRGYLLRSPSRKNLAVFRAKPEILKSRRAHGCHCSVS